MYNARIETTEDKIMLVRQAHEIEWVRKSVRMVSPEDYQIRLLEICEIRGHKFNGFILPWKGIETKVSIECPIHGDMHVTIIKYLDKRNKTGCNKCGLDAWSKSRAISADEATKRIETRCRETGYIFHGFVDGWKGTIETKLKLECKEHGKWKSAVYSSFVAKHPVGCPKCGKEKIRESQLLSDEELTSRISESEKRLNYTFIDFVGGIYKGCETRMRIKCNYCETISNTGTIQHLLMDKRRKHNGCRKCQSERQTKTQMKDQKMVIAQIKESLSGTGITFSRFDGVWKGAIKTKTILNCYKHGDFKARVASKVIVSGATCPECHTSGRPVSEETATKNVLLMCRVYGYELLGWKGGEFTHVKQLYPVLHCKEHDHVWDTTSYHSFIGGSSRGCCKCKQSGYRTDLPGYLYIQKLSGDMDAVKFGITNRRPEKRMEEHQEKSELNHELVFSYKFADGRKALELETYIKRVYKNKTHYVPKEIMQDGHTETLPVNLLDQLLELVKEMCKDLS